MMEFGFSSHCKIYHCVGSVRIQNYFGLYSVRMLENMDQNNSEHGQCLRSASYSALHYT